MVVTSARSASPIGQISSPLANRRLGLALPFCFPDGAALLGLGHTGGRHVDQKPDSIRNHRRDGLTKDTVINFVLPLRG
jgi:hypothetical protein